MYKYRKFPIRRCAGLNQERVFATSTPLSMEEVAWLTAEGPAARGNDTMDSTFDAVSEEERNENDVMKMMCREGMFECELGEGDKTIELCGAAATAFTEVHPCKTICSHFQAKESSLIG